MPVIKGITVNVLTKNGPLTEYGTRRIGSSTIFSTFIQSEDKTPFWIDFIPSAPFDYSTSLELKRNRSKTSMNGWRSPSGTWDFTAHIFIDDNQKADKNVIIDLPRCGRESEPVITARGRSCVDKDGVSSEQPWIFKEVPVEDQLAMLTTDENTEDDEWEMVSEDGTETPATCMGQIKVELFRIRQRGKDTFQKPPRRQEIPLDQSKISLGTEISHTITVGAAKPRNFQYVTVDYLDSPHAPWATIIFMYRGKKQLQNMGFIKKKDPTMKDSFAILESSPPRKLSANRVNSINERDKADDIKTPKGRGGFKFTSPISPFIEDNRIIEVKPNQHLSPPPLRAPENNLKTTPKPTPKPSLKRKPELPSDIAIGLSFMSLGKTGLAPVKGLGDFNNSGKKNPWNMRVQSESASDGELAYPKRVKIKKGDESEDEEIL